MTGPVELRVQVEPASDGDIADLLDSAGRLRIELLELDVEAVNPVIDDAEPEGSKGLGTIAGVLLVRLGTVKGLRSVISAVSGWVSRTNRAVEITLDGDVLKLTRVTSEQQERLIDAWIARHAASS